MLASHAEIASSARLALELEPEDIGALYSSAFLLEREGGVTGAPAIVVLH